MKLQPIKITHFFGTGTGYGKVKKNKAIFDSQGNERNALPNLRRWLTTSSRVIKPELIYLANSNRVFFLFCFVLFFFNKLHLYVIFLNCLIRCVLRSLKVIKLCKIAPLGTSEAGLPTCVCYFMAAIIMVITTYSTFICGITSHKTSASNIINIRRKMQTNGRHILHDKRIQWQKTHLFLELIACSVCTFRRMGK